MKKEVRIYDVARKAGVSLTVVSHVLNNTEGARVSSETRNKVLKVAKELNYKPNVFARALITKRSYLIGILFPKLVDSFVPEILQGIEDVSIQNDYGLLIYTSNDDIDKEKHNIELMKNKGVDGIIYMSDNPSEEVLNILLKDIKNLVCIGFHRNINSSYVISDNVRGAYEATEYLIKLGRRKIIHIGERESDAGIDRAKGYKQALKDNNIKFNKIVYGDFTLERGFKIVEELIMKKLKFDSIFANSDLAAIGAIKALKKHNIRIPDDVAIIGFDDLPITELIEPKLTTVHQKKYRIGELSAKILFDKINSITNNDKIILPTKLIIRETA